MADRQISGGRVIPRTINWMDLTGELGKKIQSAVTVKDRYGKEVDEDIKTTQEEINEYEVGQDQSFNDLVFNGIDEGRDQAWEWASMAKNGEMTQADLKFRINNQKDALKGFAQMSKDFDVRMKEINESIASGDAGKLEIYKNLRLAEMANLKNSRYITDATSGKGFIVKYDDEGNVISKKDVTRLNTSGNIKAVNVDLDSSIKDIVSTWKPNVNEDGRITTTSVMLGRDEEFLKSKQAVIQGIMANDQATYSVLADNSRFNIDMYTSEKELNDKMDIRVSNAKEIANELGEDFNEESFREEELKYMVKGEDDGHGDLQPVITPEFKEMAKEEISDRIMMQIGVKKTEDELRTNKTNAAVKSLEYTTLTDSFTGANPDMSDEERDQVNSKIQDIMRPGFVAKYNRHVGVWQLFVPKNGDPDSDDWRVRDGYVKDLKTEASFVKYTQLKELDAYNKAKKAGRVTSDIVSTEGMSDDERLAHFYKQS